MGKIWPMETYDPLSAPDPDEWQSMEETELMILVVDHHRESGVDLPDEQVHAIIHVVVENQVAMGDEIPVEETLKRLVREGLDRHDAIHAVGAVLFGFMQEMLSADDTSPDANEKYYDQLRKLTAAAWLDDEPTAR